jgi:glutathione S-transferase
VCAIGLLALASWAWAARRERRKRPPKLVLTYLDIKGFAEAVRLAFAVGGIEFEDVRVGYTDVQALRAAGKLPTGQVPVLEVDGVAYGQSAAILRYAGARVPDIDDRTRPSPLASRWCCCRFWLTSTPAPSFLV